MMDKHIVTSKHGSTAIRNYFTIAFTVLQTLIPFIGALAIKRLNQRKALAQDKKIPLRLITSWLSAPSTFKYLFKTWKLPGMYWGLIMLFIGLFSWATHFLVNSVYVWSLAGTCQFENGIVLQTILNEPTVEPVSVPPWWSASTWSLDSQMRSYENRQKSRIEGKIGISRKANNRATFYAKDEELLGGWNCTLANVPEPNCTIQNTDVEDIFSQFVNNGLVYPDSDSESEDSLSSPLFAYDTTDTEIKAYFAWSR